MVFIIGGLFGFFIGWKMKAAIVLIKQAKDVNYIKTVVETILSNNDIKIYKTLEDAKESNSDQQLMKELLKMKMQGDS